MLIRTQPTGTFWILPGAAVMGFLPGRGKGAGGGQPRALTSSVCSCAAWLEKSRGDCWHSWQTWEICQETACSPSQGLQHGTWCLSSTPETPKLTGVPKSYLPWATKSQQMRLL